MSFSCCSTTAAREPGIAYNQPGGSVLRRRRLNPDRQGLEAGSTYFAWYAYASRRTRSRLPRTRARVVSHSRLSSSPVTRRVAASTVRKASPGHAFASMAYMAPTSKVFETGHSETPSPGRTAGRRVTGEAGLPHQPHFHVYCRVCGYAIWPRANRPPPGSCSSLHQFSRVERIVLFPTNRLASVCATHAVSVTVLAITSYIRARKRSL